MNIWKLLALGCLYFYKQYVILFLKYRSYKGNDKNCGQKYCKQMERIQVLIEKLQQQYQQKENSSAMLVTLQLLQNELVALQNGNKFLGTSKVSVVMPTNPGFNRNVYETEPILQKPAPQPVVEVKPEPVPAPTPITRPAETFQKEYYPPKPAVTEINEQPKQNVPLFNMSFDAVEAPTLVQQQIHKEVNDIITNHKESLNDRLKKEQKEVAHILKDTPVKDLRKAIGVNDKFVFISELFRGDEAMYERSIKTINTFHILPEAEYWMNRELKVKFGWNDTNDTVQHFYQLVRRRFS
jgi:hypothetical protein